ncbi:hypothetical protein DPEC_G00003450 [Dallia pectoralis]|uniref:Uncharacterized protein n=1 Tax=Dallia pectoralis TaxID=75939 RepID=A0ACC2HJJ9_DALPE|nr:hypothetical protein DPEC_G00003450 [Dallia pectoralis]
MKLKRIITERGTTYPGTSKKNCESGAQLSSITDRVKENKQMLFSLGSSLHKVLSAVRRLEEHNERHWSDHSASPTSERLTPVPPEECRLHLRLPETYDGSPGWLPGVSAAAGAELLHLVGPALEWATAFQSEHSPELYDYKEFTRNFCSTFDHPPKGREAGERLVHLRQGTRSAKEFVLEFRTLAAGSGWNKRAPIVDTLLTQSKRCRE